MFCELGSSEFLLLVARCPAAIITGPPNWNGVVPSGIPLLIHSVRVALGALLGSALYMSSALVAFMLGFETNQVGRALRITARHSQYRSHARHARWYVIWGHQVLE